MTQQKGPIPSTQQKGFGIQLFCCVARPALLLCPHFVDIKHTSPEETNDGVLPFLSSLRLRLAKAAEMMRKAVGLFFELRENYSGNAKLRVPRIGTVRVTL